MHLENLLSAFNTIFHKKNSSQMEIQSKFHSAILSIFHFVYK